MSEIHSSNSPSVEAWGWGSLVRLKCISQNIFSWVFLQRGHRDLWEVWRAKVKCQSLGSSYMSLCSAGSPPHLISVRQQYILPLPPTAPPSPDPSSSARTPGPGVHAQLQDEASWILSLGCAHCQAQKWQGFLSLLVGLAHACSGLSLLSLLYIFLFFSQLPALCALWTSSSNIQCEDNSLAKDA